ncbi:double-strand break repair helicase AddA [Mesorhizobium sp. LHD-90]|uniref:double-strand break repair helicase AddA n=1 Tax=Mesorhizobium sp. LHD-90 TaxID=3071414 RepID=UPI0027DFEAA5|nr:double-strand break repair helicase AddA [Mesorhizobium sp. LHD-90]MDQ6434210.1 double-strand break repair helicase AddA [Mesorhizobium sp. LHD-90]
MKRVYPVPEATRLSQATASDPRNSAWVSANAGSGKTHVLSQRVIRLLLEDTDPSRILCLTYTRAAAANMSNRVFSTLSEWTMLGDEALAEKIETMEGERPGREKLARARRLFARALETPGGLKIQTIHAFCESVLHQFPLEANIAAHFDMLDPLMEEALFGAARRELLTGAMGADHPDLQEAFAAVLARGGEAGLDTLLTEILRDRDGLRRFIDAVAVDDPPYAGLFAEFGFEPGETAASVAATVWPLRGFPPAYIDAFAQTAEALDARRALERIVPATRAAMAETDPERRLKILAEGFLSGKGEPYSLSWLFNKALLSGLPRLPERYEAACEAIVTALDRLAHLRLVENTRAALTIADWLIGRYEQLKTGRGFLDFNDLITRTVRLLARQDAGPWVLYKLDKGIDHILIDEAQDTSPDQWSVVRRLAEEFFAGAGARDHVRRTVFAVGDEKQSIYSFQGAAPEAFAESGHAFSERVRGAAGRFEHVRLNLSFRSTDDVLAAVDRVFANEQARRGLTFAGDPVEHAAIRAGAPGYVELWPSLGADTVEEPDDWTTPIDHATAPAVRLAETIAKTVDRWLKSGEVIEGSGKRLGPGDVLVLVRKRGSFVNALAKSLKDRHIRVAGADRLSLPAHIAVKDMIALGRFVLQPEDDLSLAALLKSPVFGLSEEALFALAAGRAEGVSLAESLQSRSSADSALAGIAKTLERWASEAAFRRPFEFYSGVLGRDEVRSKMIARLGQEAGDILDEFLNFALAQEKTGLPGLETFLATLQSAAPEIKREMDQTRDEVRIMTVHAAKGLEAPVVFLVDGGSQPFSAQHLPRLIPFSPKGDLAGTPGYLWRAPGETPAAFVRGIEAGIGGRADDEYRRLLYVGMTRAEDRLVVCGFHGRRPPPPTSWHSLVAGALAGAPGSAELDHPVAGKVLRFRRNGGEGFAPEAATEAEEAPPAILPSALLVPLPPDKTLPRPLAPSGASSLLVEAEEVVVSGRSPVLDADEEPGFAIARGNVLHKLLQVLPDMEAMVREGAARRYLDRAAADWPASERDAALASVLAILDAENFRPLFLPGSRPEVAVMGELEVRGQRRAVSGKIDRLAVTDREVMIVDYKTNRPAPRDPAAVPPAYVAQLALYRALLRPIYPDKTVSAALLFTEAPRLIVLPAQAMDEALVRLTKA